MQTMTLGLTGEKPLGGTRSFGYLSIATGVLMALLATAIVILTVPAGRLDGRGAILPALLYIGAWILIRTGRSRLRPLASQARSGPVTQKEDE